MRVLVVDGRYYEIPEHMENDQVALDYIETINKITDEEMKNMVEGPPGVPPPPPPTPSPPTRKAGGHEGDSNE